MDTLLHATASNVGWAAALALAATIAGRAFRQRPALTHALWVLVLAKLLLPSLILHRATPAADAPVTRSIPVVPDGPRHARRPESPELVPPGESPNLPSSAVGTQPRPAAIRPWPWASMLVGAWLAGSSIWFSAILGQVRRFRRLLRVAQPAPPELRDRVARLSARLGLQRGPSLWMVPARIPPLLWAVAGPPRLLLPAELWDRFDDEQRDSILVHELAHLRRRDHWVRWLEALALGLYWWNPVAWWARRQVEESEERCCDAWVVWALPGAVHAYAEALVATAVFLSGPRPTCPSLASGVGHVAPLRRRLNMILRDPAPGLMARPGPRAAVVLGVLCLPFLPTSAPADPPEPTSMVPQAAVDGGGAIVPSLSPAAPAQIPGGPAAVAKPVELADPEALEVARPIVRTLRDFEEYVGHVEAARRLEIRARVGGTLERANFQDGVVEPGDILFEIDSRAAQAEFDRVDAEVGRSEARLARATADNRRAEALKARNAIGSDEFDRITEEYREREAALIGTRATRDLARLKLEATKIKAPFRGRMGSSRLSEGALVMADTTVLATLDSLDPMDVSFDIDERTALKLGRARREDGFKVKAGEELSVSVELADEINYPRPGRVENIGTRFDPGTGTLRCRASVANADGLLLPGMFARVRLITGMPVKKLLVPEDAIETNGGKKSIWVENEQGTVERRAIEVGSLHAGLRIIAEGLQEREWVAIEALAAIKKANANRPLNRLRRVELPGPAPDGP